MFIFLADKFFLDARHESVFSQDDKGRCQGLHGEKEGGKEIESQRERRK